ncbi:MAG TPA: hypothetical protein PLH65_00875 [bacterium]|nr:hypothetical protein [bacterium]
MFKKIVIFKINTTVADKNKRCRHCQTEIKEGEECVVETVPRIMRRPEQIFFCQPSCQQENEYRRLAELGIFPKICRPTLTSQDEKNYRVKKLISSKQLKRPICYQFV